MLSVLIIYFQHVIIQFYLDQQGLSPLVSSDTRTSPGVVGFCVVQA